MVGGERSHGSGWVFWVGTDPVFMALFLNNGTLYELSRTDRKGIYHYICLSRILLVYGLGVSIIICHNISLWYNFNASRHISPWYIFTTRWSCRQI